MEEDRGWSPGEALWTPNLMGGTTGLERAQEEGSGMAPLFTWDAPRLSPWPQGRPELTHLCRPC